MRKSGDASRPGVYRLPVAVKERMAPVELTGAAGQLEALLHYDDASEPIAAAVVCHPHPLYGGNMHNKVVHRVDRALFSLGVASLRFNFRGVGASAGRYDQGYGERDDAIVARDSMAERYPGKPIIMAGFSFGSDKALNAAWGDDRVVGVILLGTSEAAIEDRDPTDVSQPFLLIHGSNDEIVPIGPAQAWAERLAPPSKLAAIDGADHFFMHHLDQVEALVTEAARGWLEPEGL